MESQGIQELAKNYFAQGFHCAESVLKATCDTLGYDDPAVPRAATAFGGGMARTQGTCGVLSGGLIAIGMLLGRDEPTGDRERAEAVARAFIHWFEERAGRQNCRDIIQLDFANEQERTAFRAPGGRHEAVCVPLVQEAVLWLCRHIDS